MKNFISRGPLMPALAASVALAAFAATPAQAQTAAPLNTAPQLALAGQDPATQAEVDAAVALCNSLGIRMTRADLFFGTCQVVDGVSFTAAEWSQLRRDGILIKVSFNQAKIDRHVAEYGARHDETREAIDQVNKEGAVIDIYQISAEGLTRIQKDNGIDISNNAFRLTGWTFQEGGDGMPIYDEIVWGENWQTIFSRNAAAAGANLLAGAGTAVVSNQTRRGCGAACRQQPNVQSTEVDIAIDNDLIAQLANQVTVGGDACGTGTCPPQGGGSGHPPAAMVAPGGNGVD